MQIQSASKKRALSDGHIGCVGDVKTINVARGCAGGRVFCYARCLAGATDPNTLLVYGELPQLLRHELDSMRRKTPLPPFVLFSTVTDGFLGGPQVLGLTRACLEILLNRGVGVTLSTRGVIPDDTISLLARFSTHVQVTVPLVSLSPEYTTAWEPNTASPGQRLFLLQRLLKAGIQPKIRIEPVIPFVNDHTEGLREVMSAFVGFGLKEAMVSFLQLRPGVEEQLRAEAPAEIQRLLLGCFPPEGKFRHLAMKQRLAGLRRIQRIAREQGLKLSACHCQNPGLPAGRCPVTPPELPPPRAQQGVLFE